MTQSTFNSTLKKCQSQKKMQMFWFVSKLLKRLLNLNISMNNDSIYRKQQFPCQVCNFLIVVVRVIWLWNVCDLQFMFWTFFKMIIFSAFQPYTCHKKHQTPSQPNFVTKIANKNTLGAIFKRVQLVCCKWPKLNKGKNSCPIK